MKLLDSVDSPLSNDPVGLHEFDSGKALPVRTETPDRAEKSAGK